MTSKTACFLAVLAAAFTVAAAGLAEPAEAKPAGTKVSVQAWPKGLFGYVVSKAPRCERKRTVIVYERRGKGRVPARDRRVGSVKTGVGTHPQWVLRVSSSKRPHYAVIAKRKGCAAALSKAIRPRAQLTAATTGGVDDFPSCGPYTAETPLRICKFNQVYAKLEQEAAFKSCVFSRGSGSCPGTAKSGSFPWGRNVWGDARVKLFWNWGNGSVQFVTYRGGDTGVAHLGGTMPGPGSPELRVDDAFAQNELGYPNGQHFYTPNLPGQGAGEVGGPLFVNFVGGSWDETGAEIYIHGYLYLKD